MRIEYEEDRKDGVNDEEAKRMAKKQAFLDRMKAKAASMDQPQQQPRTTTPFIKAGLPSELLDGIGEYDGINGMIDALPSNYSFEVKKSVWRLRQAKSKVCALQFPEGLLIYSCLIADVLRRYAGVETIIMADVTYGACCVDDFTAKSMGADFLIHYGHSCLVNIADTAIGVQYVFVDIAFDVTHLVETVRFNFDPQAKLAIVGTIQYASSFHRARQILLETHPNVFVPQAQPLSGGELLGCTSPKLPADTSAIVYVADGRFHLESIMIHNPAIPAYQYDVNNKRFTLEKYDHALMMSTRLASVERARAAKCVGIIIGTLGRQGNLKIFERLQTTISKTGRDVFVMLISEISVAKLQMMPDVDCWVQIACPRLSIDWGSAFKVPLLNPYEAEVAFGTQEWSSVYPMDYYAKNGGRWSNYYAPK